MTENFRGYVQALYGFDAVVQRTADEEWDRQSPCESWKARDVVVHVAWACELFAQMSKGIPASVPATDEQTGVPAPSDDGHQMSPSVLSSYAALNESFLDGPIETWNRSRSLCIDALDQPGVPELITRSPWGETDMDSWVGFATWDPLVHTWDLARAVGQPVIVDAELCERALKRAQDFDAAQVVGAVSADTSSEDCDRPARYAPAQTELPITARAITTIPNTFHGSRRLLTLGGGSGGGDSRPSR